VYIDMNEVIATSLAVAVLFIAVLLGAGLLKFLERNFGLLKEFNDFLNKRHFVVYCGIALIFMLSTAWSVSQILQLVHALKGLFLLAM